MHSNCPGKLNIVIVDDEPIACKNLEAILQNYVDADINILATVNSTQEAIEHIEKHKPDALFLDIEMPEEGAFHFLERIHPFEFEIVFVTAYDAYAVKAFKLHAIDYILKPIDIDEVKHAVERLQEKIAYKNLLLNKGNEYKELAMQMTGTKEPNKILLKEQNNIVAVAFSDILFIEAKGSYSKINFIKDGMDKHVVMSNSIAEYEGLMPADTFFRVHKSYLINCMHLDKVVKSENMQVVINGKYSVPVSRRRYQDMIGFLKNMRSSNK